MIRRLIPVLGLTVAVSAGCPVGPGLQTSDDPDIVGIVARSTVGSISDAFDVSTNTIGGAFIGEIVAVCGYNFNRVGPSNRVVVDGVDCRVLNYYEINGGSRFGALFFQVPNTIPPGNQRRLNVLNAGKGSDFRPQLDVHRLAYSSYTSGSGVAATDVSLVAPAWVSSNDFSVAQNPDTLVLSPDGMWAYLTSGPTLYLALLANGRTVVTATSLFNGGVGPMAISPDGNELAVGVYPASPGVPEIAMVDTSWVQGLPLEVNPSDGVVSVVGTVPSFAAPAVTSLSGPAIGTFAFTPNSQTLLATLSSSVVREYSVSGTAITQVRDYTISGSAPFGVAITPDAARALVTSLNQNTVVPIHLASQIVGTALAAGTTPLIPVVTTNGAHAVVVNVGGTNLSLYDIGTGGVTAHNPASLSLGFSPGEIALSPDGPIGVSVDNQVLVVNGNQLNYVTVTFATSSIALASYTTGTYSQTLKKVAVQPRR